MVKGERIIVGTRGSKLALLQTELALAELRKEHPEREFSVQVIKTGGDKDRHTSLEEIGGEGVFVKELEEALLQGTIDMAVHSLKDMPTKINPHLRLAAIMRREDVRDALVTKSGKGLKDLPAGSIIGTGSPRRLVQLKALRPDLEVWPLRGNVDTRLRKVLSGETDGAVLAAAALHRLGEKSKIVEYFTPEEFLPAVGQGALAIEIRAMDQEIAALVAPLDHQPTRQAVLAERAFLSHLGGGCRAPIAAWGRVMGDTLELRGMVASPQGERLLRAEERGSAASPEEVGILLAERMLQMGAGDLIAKR